MRDHRCHMERDVIIVKAEPLAPACERFLGCIVHLAEVGEDHGLQIAAQLVEEMPCRLVRKVPDP